MNILRGVAVPPIIVGSARGIVEAALMAGLIALGIAFTSIDFGDKSYIVPAILFGVRFLEGTADHIDPTTNRAPADPPVALRPDGTPQP